MRGEHALSLAMRAVQVVDLMRGRIRTAHTPLRAYSVHPRMRGEQAD